MVLPAAALVASILTVVVAAVGYVLTASPESAAPAERTAAHQPVGPVHPPTPSATPTYLHPKTLHHKHRPPVKRKSVYVVVFNNSNVSGLAGRAAARAQDVGWNVVATDNWYGNIVAPTVYYPHRLHRAAKLLAHDLGIDRLRPAIAPMQMDRLTVILTRGYRG